MVAKLSRGKNIRGAITYNEQKVTKGIAALLTARKFGKDKEDLSFKEKVDKFKIYTDKNPKAKVNTFHFSLNFHEKDMLSDKQMTDIADKFMKDIGFGKQPYLVYRHFDSGHPHIHIVSTNIQANGKRINERWNARKMRNSAEEIERDYELTLTGKNLKQANKIYQYPEHDHGIDPVDYPEKNLRNKISAIVAAVDNEYKYNSFEAYNKLLAHYNLKAIRLHANRQKSNETETYGLAYQSLKNGKEVGTPIYGSELLHLGKFTAARLDKQIASHKAANLSESLEKDVNKFLKDRITYKPSSLHQYLKAQGYIALDKGNPNPVYLDTRNKTVIALDDIKEDKLRQLMERKAQAFDMSVEEGKAITEAIQNFWQQKKQEKYDLESRMIKDIDHISFDSLRERVGEKHGKEKFDINLESYLNYKKRKLDQTLEKEKGYFKATTVNVLNYTSHLSEADRNLILNAMDIKTEKLGDLTYFEHKKYAELNDVTPLKKNGPEAQPDKIEGDEIKPWDLKMLKSYMLKQKNDKQINRAVENAVKYKKLPEGYQLLQRQDQDDFLKRFARAYIHQNKWQEGTSLKSFVSEMASKGILIKKEEDGTYNIGLHGFPENTYHKASDALNNFLNENRYENTTYESAKQTIDAYHQANRGQQSDDLPASVALLRHPKEKQDHTLNIKNKLAKMNDMLSIKEDMGKEHYDEATHKLAKKKKKRKRRTL